MSRRAGCLLGLALMSGCLTEQMGRDLEKALDRVEGRHAQPPPTGSPAFARAVGLPQRIWYCDLDASIYHERRSNTFIGWDPVKLCWLGIPNDEAFARFHPDRARLLAAGAPPDVDRALDRLVDLEPDWRGG